MRGTGVGGPQAQQARLKWLQVLGHAVEADGCLDDLVRIAEVERVPEVGRVRRLGRGRDPLES